MRVFEGASGAVDPRVAVAARLAVVGKLLSTSCARLLSLPEYSTGFLGTARLYRRDDSSPGALGAGPWAHLGCTWGDACDVVPDRESQPNKGFVTPPCFFSAEWSHEKASPSGEPGAVPDSARSSASSSPKEAGPATMRDRRLEPSCGTVALAVTDPCRNSEQLLAPTCEHSETIFISLANKERE